MSRSTSQVVEYGHKNFQTWQQGDNSSRKSWTVRVPCVLLWRATYLGEVWNGWETGTKWYNRSSRGQKPYWFNSRIGHRTLTRRKCQGTNCNVSLLQFSVREIRGKYCKSLPVGATLRVRNTWWGPRQSADRQIYSSWCFPSKNLILIQNFVPFFGCFLWTMKYHDFD